MPIKAKRYKLGQNLILSNCISTI